MTSDIDLFISKITYEEFDNIKNLIQNKDIYVLETFENMLSRHFENFSKDVFNLYSKYIFKLIDTAFSQSKPKTDIYDYDNVNIFNVDENFYLEKDFHINSDIFSEDSSILSILDTLTSSDKLSVSTPSDEIYLNENLEYEYNSYKKINLYADFNQSNDILYEILEIDNENVKIIKLELKNLNDIIKKQLINILLNRENQIKYIDSLVKLDDITYDNSLFEKSINNCKTINQIKILFENELINTILMNNIVELLLDEIKINVYKIKLF